MLSTRELQVHLRRLTWRPGWEIDVRDHPWEGPEIRIVGREQDTAGEGEIDLGVWTFLPPLDSLDEFERWLQRRLDRIAIHESHEWFKRDGHTVFDPHKPDAYRNLESYGAPSRARDESGVT